MAAGKALSVALSEPTAETRLIALLTTQSPVMAQVLTKVLMGAVASTTSENLDFNV